MQQKRITFCIKQLVPILLICACCLFGNTAKAQYIPLDTAFANYLSHNGYSHCISGNMLDTTCADTALIYTINLNGLHNIHDINSIKYFKHLSYLFVLNMTIDSIPAMPSNLYALYLSDIKDSNSRRMAPLPSSLITLVIEGNHTGADTANYFDSLPTLPKSLKYLYISGVDIQHFPNVLPDSLLNLYESQSKIYSIDSIPRKLQYLYLDDKNITHLPSFSDSLKWLYLISMQHLANLPALPSTLILADINDDTLLTSLPAYLPNSLQYLYCYNEHIKTLPSTLPSALKVLYMYTTQLSSLPALPKSLKQLIIPYNNITSLPTLPDSLQYLYTASNPLKVLPAHLPDSLIYLWCSYDSLNKMPTLPAHIQGVWCDDNQIDTLPMLPSSLKYLGCGANKLTYLPAPLPDSLYYLYFDVNNISVVPALPKKLYSLSCSSNPNLSGIPDLPKTLFYINADYDTSIRCLPVLNYGMYLYFYDTRVSCVPNYAPYYAYPSLSSFPLCSFGGSCETGWNITGHVYSDSLRACVFDTIDPVYSNVRVLLYAHDTLSQVSYSTGNGGFTFRTSTIDTFYCKVDTTHLSYKVKCPATDTIVKIVTATDSIKQHADFVLECKNGYDGAIWNIYTWNWYFQPGHMNEVAVYGGDISKQYGLHCLDGIGGKVVVHVHGPVTYDSVPTYSLTPASANNDSIVWVVSDFGKVDPLKAFHFYLKTDTNVIWYDTVGIWANIKINTIDADSINNTLRNRFWVYTSWDPNSKEVYPSKPTSTSDWITYTIHFENDGKASADNIHINDTLDKNLDWSTFQVVSSDHPVHAHVNANGVVQFYFNMIHLADSLSDPKHCSGYVKYKLKMKTGVPYGTTIKNKAYVYFDYNPAVITNTALSTLTHAEATTENISINSQTLELTIFPNPIKNWVTLKLNGTASMSVIQLLDITGRKIASYENPKGSDIFRVNLNAYPSGVYLIKVWDQKDNCYTHKLIVSH